MMNKVKGTEDPADMNTKGLSGDEIAKYGEILSMGYQEGIANLISTRNPTISQKTKVPTTQLRIVQSHTQSQNK